MKVFGIGLSKTGTKSLRRCFLEWDYNHQSCRRDWLVKWRQGEVDAVLREMEPFDTFEDWPYALMYREIFDRYGQEAKFVLTKRVHAEAWLNSLKRHSYLTSPTGHCRLLAYNYAYPHGFEREHLRAYEAHLIEVRQFFQQKSAEEQLLEVCWETGDGWPKLCQFLSRPVPATPFPHENSRKQGDPKLIAENTTLIKAQLALLGLDPAEHFEL